MEKSKLRKGIMRLFKFILAIIGIGILGFAGLIVYLMITDYRPDEITSVETLGSSDVKLSIDEPVSVMTWNIGYAGLGKEEDFFMDGGTKPKPDSEDMVRQYLDGIQSTLREHTTDIVMIQEIDRNSSRTYYLDEYDVINNDSVDQDYAFAYNYKVKFVPVPIPPLGKVEAGQATYSKYNIKSSSRYSLPGQYAFPKYLVMLDRCLLVNRVEVEGTDGELVLINAHFSAYDDGSIRSQQMAYVKELIQKEYALGNYVVLGGDWNQTFDYVDDTKYPLFENGAMYTPYKISSDWLLPDWKWGGNTNAPTYRLLNAPYEEGVTQIGIIDGFLVSPNVDMIKAEILDLGFENSDHNPVVMSFELKK